MSNQYGLLDLNIIYAENKAPNNITSDARNNQISRSAAIAALGTIEIRQYGLAPGPGGNLQVIEQWQLMNGWVKDVKFGDLSYDNDGLLNVALTIRYDWAEKTL